MEKQAQLESVSFKVPSEGKRLLEDQADGRYMRFSSYLRFLLLRGLEEVEPDLDLDEETLIV